MKGLVRCWMGFAKGVEGECVWYGSFVRDMNGTGLCI